jgi:hypothetical protein
MAMVRDAATVAAKSICNAQWHFIYVETYNATTVLTTILHH